MKTLAVVEIPGRAKCSECPFLDDRKNPFSCRIFPNENICFSIVECLKGMTEAEKYENNKIEEVKP
jgi:hypothetical protein